MRSLPTTAAAAAIIVGLTSCGGDAEPPPEATTSAGYLQAVGELLAPPTGLAAATAERLAGEDQPGRVDVASLAAAARRERDEFASLRLDSPVLERQRDDLLAGYADVVATLDPVVDAHLDDNQVALVVSARALYGAMQALPAAVPPPDAE